MIDILPGRRESAQTLFVDTVLEAAVWTACQHAGHGFLYADRRAVVRMPGGH